MLLFSARILNQLLALVSLREVGLVVSLGLCLAVTCGGSFQGLVDECVEHRRLFLKAWIPLGAGLLLAVRLTAWAALSLQLPHVDWSCGVHHFVL